MNDRTVIATGNASGRARTTTPRCESCGRFTSGPMIGVDVDSSEPGNPVYWIGPCCQTPADLRGSA